MLSNKLHSNSLAKMLERAIFDAQFAGDEGNGAITRMKALEKFNGGESEDTTKTCLLIGLDSEDAAPIMDAVACQIEEGDATSSAVCQWLALRLYTKTRILNSSSSA